MYLGRFFSLLSLDEIFTQSLFGKNIRKIDHLTTRVITHYQLTTPDLSKNSRPKTYSHIGFQKFLINSMYDLVTDESGETSLRDSKVHTLTHKDPNNIISPTIAALLEWYYNMKPRPTDDNEQNNFGQYKHLVEQEMQGDELRDFLSICKHPLNKEYHEKFENHFKLALQTSPLIIQERIERASK